MNINLVLTCILVFIMIRIPIVKSMSINVFIKLMVMGGISKYYTVQFLKNVKFTMLLIVYIL